MDYKIIKFIFTVIDAFTIFCLVVSPKIYRREVILKLKIHKTIFVSPSRIISDRGAAFTSEAFRNCYTQENVQHSQFTTGQPRANG